jgi:hypothetical protein
VNVNEKKGEVCIHVGRNRTLEIPLRALNCTPYYHTKDDQRLIPSGSSFPRRDPFATIASSSSIGEIQTAVSRDSAFGAKRRRKGYILET